MILEGSRILVTGGSLGIGKATAAILTQSGAKVAITGRNGERLKKAAEQIGALPIQGDVSNESDVLRTMDIVMKEWGGLDVLVNNAAVGVHKPMSEITSAEMEEAWRVNVLGAFLMAREAAKVFVQQKRGNIVNISSTSSLRGYETGTAYVATKFALRGMTECWRAELRKYNVRIILINPSEVTTAFGNPKGIERPEQPNKLRSVDIAHTVKSALEMDDRGFITDLTVFATNPW